MSKAFQLLPPRHNHIIDVNIGTRRQSQRMDRTKLPVFSRRLDRFFQCFLKLRGRDEAVPVVGAAWQPAQDIFGPDLGQGQRS